MLTLKIKTKELKYHFFDIKNSTVFVGKFVLSSYLGNRAQAFISGFNFTRACIGLSQNIYVCGTMDHKQSSPR